MEFDHPDVLTSLKMPFEIGKCELSCIKLRNVTRLDLGPCIGGASCKLTLWYLILSFLNTDHLNYK